MMVSMILLRRVLVLRRQPVAVHGCVGMTQISAASADHLLENGLRLRINTTWRRSYT